VSPFGQALSIFKDKAVAAVILCTFERFIKEINLYPSPSDTAIFLFSRSATRDSMSKPLVQKHQSAQRGVAQQLIRQALRVAKSSGFPVFHLTEHQQRGHDFGTRFAHAFEQLFALGFQQVISIGNDCPELATSDLTKAAQQLAHTPFVFGPSTDGGAYLVGIRRDAYVREAFLAVPWQTPGTLQALTVQSAGQFSLLSEKADIDTPADLQRLLRVGRIYILLKIRLLQYLQEILHALIVWHEAMPQRYALRSRPLRGPPWAPAR